MRPRIPYFMALSCSTLLMSSININQAIADTSNDTKTAVIENIIITGSYLSVQQDDIASPIDIIGREQIQASGAASLNDFLSKLTTNVGAEFNADIFTQNTSGGTSQFNLRGIGLSSTLTLLNGRRTTLSGAYANDGSTFVDINSIPMIALERIEIVKDGASALYGSDAVAGVVDFVTRQDFEGIEFSTGYQTTTDDHQIDKDISLLWGWQNDQVKSLVALSYFNRSPLEANKRAFTHGTGISALGYPASFIPLGPIDPNSPYAALDGLAPAGTPIRDANCEVAGGFIPEGANPYFGTCYNDYMQFFNLLSKEKRQQALVTLDIELTDDTSFFSEALYAKNKQSQPSSPSFPNLTFPIIPADNIGNLATNGGFGTPVIFLGSPLSVDAQPAINKRTSETLRLLMGIRQNINSHWQWESAYQYSYNDYYLGGPDTLIDRFNAALNGVGGPNNDQYYNPFSTALYIPALANSQAVIDDFTDISARKIRTSLHTWDAQITGELFNLPAGPVKTAFGIQYRNESNRQTLDQNSQDFNYAFVIGASNSNDKRNIWGLFSEVLVPVTEQLNLQLAGRFEQYSGNTDNSFTPKLGIRWNPNEEISLRGSISRAFRAPSLHQTSSNTIATENIDTTFAPIVTDGNNNLKPEEALIVNTGIVYNPSNNLTASLDYWRYDYDDIIIKENAEGIFSADPYDERIIRDPNSGAVSRVELNFINASSVLTDGVDFHLNYRMATDYGQFTFTNNTSYIKRYDLTLKTGDSPVNAVGQRNALNIARALPRWRSNFTLDWAKGDHQISTTARYIHDYKDDANNNNSIDRQITLDGQYNYLLPTTMEVEPKLSFGVINLFNQQPPAVATSFGFDTKTHDPRGRLVYLRLSFNY